MTDHMLIMCQVICWSCDRSHVDHVTSHVTLPVFISLAFSFGFPSSLFFPSFLFSTCSSLGMPAIAFSHCNNSGYECCGRKEGRKKGRNNRKEYHSTSRARKVRSEIMASYCNILKVSQVLAFSTLGRCSFPFYRQMEGAPKLTYGTTRVHSP